MSKTMGCDSCMGLAKKKGPMFFGVLPMKSVILFMQFLAIFYQTYQFQDCFGCFLSTVYLIRIILIAVSFIGFIGYLLDRKTVMKVHLWTTIFVLAIPVAILQIGVFLYCTFLYICKITKSASEMSLDEKMRLEDACNFFYSAVYTGVYYFCSFLACCIFYVWMCHKVIKALDTELNTVSSTSDTNEFRSEKLTKKCD
ncbi:hypothetical protein GCK72_009463 [Caenorhabditis remanei]|uniref:Uncharacterized protein n=1 Tax=Caenorhabditis remanei TaxID=31234 RepID=A0A6A5H2L7_CAERE|nr:hypothetical protein GCK72_009463 [Caenorhabditis remanei]KAF1761209.1 hypothetical protein GCK72_009463 [Caenorhabditis remanei]